MTSVKLIITGAISRAEVDGLLTSGMVGIPVTIEYDSDWDGLTKTLVCKAAGSRPDGPGVVKAILNVGNEATVAPEVMIAKKFLYLGVEGRNAEGTLVIPTVWALCGIIRSSADVDDDSSTDPTLPVWAQLQAQIDELKQIGVSDEQIAKAVGDALAKIGGGNSADCGLTSNIKNALLTILDAVIVEASKQNAVSEALNALKSLWSGGEVYVSQNGTVLALNNVTAVTSITQTGTVLALA